VDTAAHGARSDGRELAGLNYREIEDFPRLAEMKYSDAIAAVSGRWLETHPEAVELGEEIANFGGGAYGATRGLPQRFPGRVLNTPISEGGFVGLACGAAMRGMPVIVEIMFPDFSLVAADQLFNQIAKARHMYGGSTDLPLVARTRIATGCGYGGQHSMDPAGSSPCSPAGAWWLPATPSTTSACSTRPCAAWTRW
jgi:2-oxoisovalerate dehydrogenase E1 component